MNEPLPEAPTPTEVGKRQWPPSGYYEGLPCMCKETCTYACTGKCGCEACHVAYMDWFSSQ